MTKLRDKAAQLRRDHIVEAATKVFAAKGYHRATIRDIAREAGVADGTIYTSFENKTALLLAILDPLDEASAATPAVKPGADMRQLMAEAIQRRFTHMTQAQLDVTRVVLSEALVNDELRVLYVERVLQPALVKSLPVLKGLAATGQLKAADPALASRLLVGAFLGLTILRLMGDKVAPKSWQQLGNALVDAVLPDSTALTPSAAKRRTRHD